MRAKKTEISEVALFDEGEDRPFIVIGEGVANYEHSYLKRRK